MQRCYHHNYGARLLNYRILISALIAILVVLPHGFWLFEHMDEIASRAGQRFGEVEKSYFARISSALPAALWAMGSFLLPFVAIVFVAAPSIFQRLRAADKEIAVFRDATLICGAGLLAGILITGASSFPERYAIAFYVSSFILVYRRFQKLLAQRKSAKKYYFGWFCFFLDYF